MSRTLVLDTPEEVYESLAKRAEQTGQSLETVASQWLAAAAPQQSEDDPLESFIGAFDSHGLDWADGSSVDTISKFPS